MEHTAIDEIVRQHVVIEAWLDGRPDAQFASFETALGAGFSMVTPDGSVVERGRLLDGFGPAFGTIPGLRIEVRNAALVDSTNDRAVVRYEEWQFTTAGGGNRRVSTAILAPDPAGPIGWVWAALHETWLPAAD